MVKGTAFRIKLSAIMLVVSATYHTTAAADYAEFARARACTLKTSGLGLGGVVRDFPVLVRLNAADNREVFENARPDGCDIRFSKSDGQTPLPFELERWDVTGTDSVAEFWVLLDTISPDNDAQHILMHFGNSAASTDVSADSLVFNGGNGFVGVWHFGSADALGDATGNGYGGTNYGSAALTSGSLIGHGREFDGTDDYIDVPGFPDDAVVDRLTISSWVNLDDQSDWREIVAKADTDYKSGSYGLRKSNMDAPVFTVDISGDMKREIGSGTLADDGNTWVYLAGVLDGSYQRLYMDGAEVSSRPESGSIKTTANSLNFARRSDNPSRLLDGRLDEIRISKIGRSPDWITLCYHTQKPNANAVSFGPVVDKGPSAPQILSQPQPLSVQEGREASFSVGAIGNPRPSYQWQKNGVDLQGATLSTYTIPSATFDDSGAYRCAVTNSEGTVTSAGATLTVQAAPPVIRSVAPLDTLIAVGTTVTFTVDAGGTAPLSYSWITMEGDTVGTGSSLVITPQSQAAYDGNRYYCAVSNARGSVESDTVILRVVTPVRAAFGAEPTRAQDSLQTIFTDSSTGSILEWRWYFGDGDSTRYTPTEKPSLLSHLYREEGEYVCSLIVVGQGPAGRDTAVSEKLAVFPPTDNPLTLTGRFLAADRIEVGISGAESINTNPVLGPTASRAGLWVNREGGDIDTAADPRVAVFERSAMVQSSPFVAVVNVPPSLLPVHRRYRLWVSPLWESGPGRYNVSNATEVVMKPVNELRLTGVFAGCPGTPDSIALNTDSLQWARVRVERTGTVDTVGVEQVALSWGFAGGDVLGTDTLTPAQLGSSPYTWTIRNEAFFGDTQQVFARTVQVASNGLTSDQVETKFYVGWPRPANPIADMRAEAVLSSRVRLTWRWAGATEGIAQVLLWQSKSPLPGNKPDISTEFPPETLQVTDTTRLVTGLNRETRYYFGVQVQKNLLRSLITTGASTSDSTPTFTNQDSVPNTVAIDTAWFDRETNGIRIVWRVDTLRGVEMEWGVVDALSPTGIADLSREPRGTIVEAVRETTLVAVDNVRFDTTYYVGIWLRGLDGPWSLPTDSSSRAVRSPTFTWEGVSYFPSGDTVQGFNGNVVLRKDSTYTYQFAVDDTLDYFVPTNLPRGLIPVSIGFSLRRGGTDRQKFFAGLRYNTAALGGRPTRELALFRKNNDRWLVEHGSFVEGGYVWAKTSSFSDDQRNPVPFVAMLDTVGPAITLPDTGRVADPDSSLIDNLLLRDNCANVIWSVSYARDDEPFAKAQTADGVICGSCDSAPGVSWTIPASYVTERTGVRAFLTVSDGVHRDTINVSHRARRKDSDAVTTEKMEWVPISATARLDNPAASEALSRLAPIGEPWSYDTKRFRLFRWIPTGSNAGQEDKWVEYDEARKELFSFEPGRLLWLKTRERIPVSLGGATTLSLKDTFSVSLPPMQWADMALPYRFDIRVADILRATGQAGEGLEFYRWERGETTEFGTTEVFFVTKPVYIGEMPGVDEPAVAVRSALLAGNTVFNASSTEVRLRIPPTPAGVSGFKKAAPRKKIAHKSEGNRWSVKLLSRASSGRPLNTVYCGFASGGDGSATTYFSPAPSFGRQSVRVCDPATGRLYGHGVHHRMRRGGCAYRIAFRNESPREETIRCRIEHAVAPPGNLVTRFFDPAGSAGLGEGEGMSVDVVAGGREERFLLVGDEAYCASFGELLASVAAELVTCRFNRAAACVELHYRLPWVDVGEVRFSAFDMRGRTVWRHRVTPERGGAQVVAWDMRDEARRSPAGVYVVRMRVHDHSGRVTARFRQRVGILP